MEGLKESMEDDGGFGVLADIRTRNLQNKSQEIYRH
jgi:hypothetical protein